jgi:hypothetical protein
MSRTWLPLAVLAVAACEPSIPDSASGVGFDSYQSYQQQRIERDQALREAQRIDPNARAIGSETIAAVDPAIGAPPAPQAAAPGAPLADAGVAGTLATATATAAPQPAPAPVVTTNNPGISDEQDFNAVSERQTIESDAERLERQRAAYEVVAPQPLPQRQGSGGPNIVEFALSTTNAVGQSLYRRSGFNAESRFNRACGRYSTADEAQRAFLGAGGPERDRMGVDPDGDGFACFWDPSPFRAARGG